MTTRIALCLACSLALSGLAHAQELQGAKRVIEAASRIDGDAPPTPVSFVAMRDEFINASDGMSAEEAVAGWLKLLDTRLKITAYTQDYPFVALPRVETWDVLASELDKRVAEMPDPKGRALWLLASLLRGNEEELRSRLATLRITWADEDDLLSYVDEFEKARWPDNRGSEVEEFRKNLKKSDSYFHIPDLTGLPRPEAEELLFQAMNKTEAIYFADEETRKIAAEAVLRNPERLKRIAWELVGSPADMALIEVMVPQGYVLDHDSHSAQQGLAYYFQSLVDKRAFDKADAIRKQFSRSDLYQLVPRSGDGLSGQWRKNSRDYVFRVLNKDASQPFWSELGQLAAPDDNEVWDFIRTALEQNRLTRAEDKQAARSEWLEHLFETGREAEAMDHLARFTADSSGMDLQRWLFQQVKAADLLGDKATADKANDRLEEVIKRTEFNSEFVTLELRRGRLAALEKITGEWLKNSQRESWSANHDAVPLMRIYDAAGRPDDVLAMLDDWPKWNCDDLSGLISSNLPESGICAARALVAKGRSSEAVGVLKEVVKLLPDTDQAYAELLRLVPGECESYLKDLSAKRPFEERPLIWLAQLYSNEGRLDEGESAIRKAIAIDPSDGDMGKGDRMRAYRVLGEIQRKQGKTEEAEFMAKVDKAIRLSEDADDWWEAGMPRRALAMYDEALQIFSDAYCIQSRLALRYEEMGDSENALKFYQRAFELMPDSFGRIESHCFGCEGAFNSPVAQSVAERVFTAMAAKPDAKAQVFYLLGYLRASQERPKEAVECFRKAVEKDPDYVNALSKLVENADAGGLPGQEKDRAISRLVEVDGATSPANISDLRLMWKTVLEADRRSAWKKPKEPLYPLTAARMDRMAKVGANDNSPRHRDELTESHRQSMSSNAFIQIITQMFGRQD